MLSRYRGEQYRDQAHPTLVALVESDELHAMDYGEALAFYMGVSQVGTTGDKAFLAAVDRYYLLTHVLLRPDALHPWLYDRCREVELEPDYHLDLWAREHYKSTIITFAGIMQEIINDPEITIGVFSHTKSISSKFVAQLKREFEGNANLRKLYPDVCWVRPSSEAPTWSNEAFTVRREGNPKESTVEAHGLVEGQPTSRHFMLRVYDDVVTRESVTTPEQVSKTTEAFELSDNLGAGEGRIWMIGTRYSFGDTYGTILERKIVTPRLYPATDNGRADGNPVFMTLDQWAKKKRTQLSTLAAQMLQNPLSGKDKTFQARWFRPWYVRPVTLNVYIMGDPSRGKTAKSDRTAIAVMGIDAQGNKYLLDGMRHRMTLSDRWDALKFLHKKWTAAPGVNFVKVGYERYGQQSDDEYFQERMRRENYSFHINELAWPLEGGASKAHRVERLQPDFQYASLFLPGLTFTNGIGTVMWTVSEEDEQLVFEKPQGELSEIRDAKLRGQEYLVCKPIVRKDEEGKPYDVTRALMDEALYFPYGSHDDLIDAVSRIYDMEPVAASQRDVIPEMEMAGDE